MCFYFFTDEIKSARGNGWYARRKEKEGRRSSGRIRSERRGSRRREGTRGRTSCSRSAAPRRGCWNRPTPAAPLSGERVGQPPPPTWWCSRPHNLWRGDPPRESSTAARNEPRPLVDSTESLAKVSGQFFQLDTDTWKYIVDTCG